MNALLTSKALQGWLIVLGLVFALYSAFAPKIFGIFDQHAEHIAVQDIYVQLNKRLNTSAPVQSPAEDVQFAAIDQDYVLNVQRLIFDLAKKAGATISQIQADEVDSESHQFPPSVSILLSFDGDLEAFAKLLQYLKGADMFIVVESYTLRPLDARSRADKQMRSEMTLQIYRKIGGG